MSVVYRSEKKKILYTNIDLCNYLLSILVHLKGMKRITIREFNRLCMEKSFLEKQEGLIRRWVHNGDPIFSEEEQFFRRRLGLRQYLKDLSELIGVKEEEKEISTEPPTIFDRIISREIPADIFYEDEFCLAFRDQNPVAPVHFLVVLKVKRGLTTVSKAEERHEAVIGHLMIMASKLAEKEGCAKDGYRVVINEGLHGGLSIDHFFLHVIGGKQLSWPPGV